MEHLTPGQIVLLVVAGLLATSSFINQVGNAVEKVAKAWRAAKAPNAAQDTRLDALEAWQKGMDAADLQRRVKELEEGNAKALRLLAKDKQELDTIHESLRLSHLAQLALLDHALNGNNIDQMQDAKDALLHHLSNK